MHGEVIVLRSGKNDPNPGAVALLKTPVKPFEAVLSLLYTGIAGVMPQYRDGFFAALVALKIKGVIGCTIITTILRYECVKCHHDYGTHDTNGALQPTFVNKHNALKHFNMQHFSALLSMVNQRISFKQLINNYLPSIIQTMPEYTTVNDMELLTGITRIRRATSATSELTHSKYK